MKPELQGSRPRTKWYDPRLSREQRVRAIIEAHNSLKAEDLWALGNKERTELKLRQKGGRDAAILPSETSWKYIRDARVLYQ